MNKRPCHCPTGIDSQILIADPLRARDSGTAPLDRSKKQMNLLEEFPQRMHPRRMADLKTWVLEYLNFSYEIQDSRGILLRYISLHIPRSPRNHEMETQLSQPFKTIQRKQNVLLIRIFTLRDRLLAHRDAAKTVPGALSSRSISASHDNTKSTS